MNKLLSLTIDGKTINPPNSIKKTSDISLDSIIQVGVQLLFLTAILITLFYLAQGGIQWIVSGGDKQKIEQARLRLVYAIVGLIIIFGAFFLVNTVFGIFRVNFSK